MMSITLEYNRPIDEAVYKRVIWDYNLSRSDFEAILHGKKTIGSFNQAWAISRILENVNYYDATKLVPLALLAKHWKDIKRKVFKDSIKKGYDFVLHRYALPTSR